MRYSVLRGILIITVALLSGWFGFRSYNSYHQKITLLDAPSVRLIELNKGWLVVNYFAEWCSPCVRELPALSMLANDPSLSHVEVLTVNYDQLPEAGLRKLKQQFAIDAPIVTDYAAIQMIAPMPNQLPTTYIFAPGGELYTTLLGEQTEHSILAEITQSPQLAIGD